MKRYFSLYRLLVLFALFAAAFSALAFTPPALADGETTGVVNVDALNLRVGPGLPYKVARLLQNGQTLRLLGRSADSQWLEVRLPGGAGGWVYGAYVTAAAPISALPVSEAAGGPSVPTAQAQVYPCAGTPWDLCMSIDDDQATVYLQQFPKNAAVVVRLSLPGGGAEVEAARGQTDANGSAQIKFQMPGKWADGRAITETDLTITVRTADGNFSRTASIRYVQ